MMPHKIIYIKPSNRKINERSYIKNIGNYKAFKNGHTNEKIALP